MSFWIEHDKGKELTSGEFTGTHLKDLYNNSGPKMKKFLDTGTADEALVKAIIKELELKFNLRADEKEILRKFKRCTPPVILTDGFR